MNPQGQPRRRLRSWTLSLLVLALFSICCDDTPDRPLPVAGPTAVPDPELAEMEPQVRELLRQARERLVADDQSADGWGNLGSLYDAHGMLEPATTCYRRAIELAPDEFLWNYLLAIAREIDGADVDEVSRLFVRAEGLREDYGQIQLRLGDALSRRGENARARERFERAVEMLPGSATAQRGLGQVLLAEGEPEAAIRALNQAVILQPNDRVGYAGLAQAYTRLGDEENAQRAVELADKLEPVNAIDDPAWGEWVYDRSVSSSRVFRRGRSRLDADDDAGAAADFKLVLENKPDDASAHFWLASALRNMGQKDEALIHYLEAAELQDTLLLAHTRAGELLYAAGRYTEAEQSYRAAIALRFDDPALHLALAEVQMRTGDLAGLVESYAAVSAVTVLGGREEANFGVALMRLGRTEEAALHLEKSLARRPGNPNALYNLGLAYEELGRHEEAVARFLEAARVDPNHAAARHLAEHHTQKP